HDLRWRKGSVAVEDSRRATTLKLSAIIEPTHSRQTPSFGAALREPSNSGADLGPVLSHTSRESAATAHSPGCGNPTRRRRDRLSDRFELRAWLSPRRRGGGNTHPADSRGRRPASPDARPARSLRNRPLRKTRQLAIQDRSARYTGCLYVSVAGDP